MSSFVTPGELLAGKYRVERVLGEGGMGIVVKATHIQLEQPVALKFLQAHALKNAAVVERFAREAKALAKLKSDHVTHVIDVGNLDDGSPYIVMEYLDGEDLSALLEREGSLPVEDAVGYVLEACEAIAEAHAARIIHRDLKPANLFLAKRASDRRPIVKVLDFGISKALDDGAALTKTAAGLGSAYYMAPEQMRNAKNCDERADLWAIGVTLYELLSGCVPFEGGSVHQVVAAVLEQNRKRLSERVPTIPAAIDELIERCLVLEPKERIGSIVLVAEALVPFGPAGSYESLARIRRLLAVPSVAKVEAVAMTTQPNTRPRTDPSTRDLSEMANAKTEAQLPTADGQSLPNVVLPSPSSPAWARLPVLAGAAVGLVLLGVGGATFLKKDTSANASQGSSQVSSLAPPSDPLASAPLQSAAPPAISPSAVPSGLASGGLPSPVALPSHSTLPANGPPIAPPKKTEKPPVTVAIAPSAPAAPTPAPPAPAPSHPSGIVPISTMGIK